MSNSLQYISPVSSIRNIFILWWEIIIFLGNDWRGQLIKRKFKWLIELRGLWKRAVFKGLAISEHDTVSLGHFLILYSDWSLKTKNKWNLKNTWHRDLMTTTIACLYYPHNFTNSPVYIEKVGVCVCVCLPKTPTLICSIRMQQPSPCFDISIYFPSIEILCKHTSIYFTNKPKIN